MADALSLPCVFVGLPLAPVIRLAAWLLHHSVTIGRWVGYFVIYLIVFAILWNIFLGPRWPDDGDDD